MMLVWMIGRCIAVGLGFGHRNVQENIGIGPAPIKKMANINHHLSWGGTFETIKMMLCDLDPIVVTLLAEGAGVDEK